MSDAPKFTPGPWTTCLSTSNEPSVCQQGDAFLLAKMVYPPNRVPEAEANARLIAAAPDMYAALEDMLSGWNYIRLHHGDLPGVGWDRAEDAASAALARARGDA